MAAYRLSLKTLDDLNDIALYTLQEFGLEQSHRYRDGIKACFQNLADNPRLGRRADNLAPALRRVEHESHVVFYTSTETGVLIVRVLHERMDFKRHLDDTP